MKQLAWVALVGLGCSRTPEPPPVSAEANAVEPQISARPVASVAGRSLQAIAGDLPTDVPAQLAAHAACEAEACPTGLLYPPGGEVGLETPALMWSQRLAAGVELALPSHGELTLYGVVVAGAVSLGAQRVERWHAFRAPGVGVAITGTSEASALVLALVSNSGPAAAQMAQGAHTTPSGMRAPPEVVDIAKQRDWAFAGGSSHVRIVFDDGPASMQVMLTSPDAPVPAHQHPEAWEVIGLLRANGVFTLGEATRDTKTEAILAIPPKMLHAWKPAGDTPLIAIQFYIPPGPEQRFKELAGD